MFALFEKEKSSSFWSVVKNKGKNDFCKIET